MQINPCPVCEYQPLQPKDGNNVLCGYCGLSAPPDLWNRLTLADDHIPDTGKKVRVRAAVGIDGEGNRLVLGAELNNARKESVEDVVRNSLVQVDAWLEADIPIREPQTVRGRVVEDGT